MNRVTDGVGKKIVEALKQQSDIEIQSVIDNSMDSSDVNDFQSDLEVHNSDFNSDNSFEADSLFKEEVPSQQYNVSGMKSFSIPVSHVQDKEVFASDLDDFEMPTNVAILKQLINQLPSGVSRQTGAQIIKQTMEALGISMKSVLQEAQQVQENLNNSVKECQASVMEYKKQINVLERQSQKFLRQSAALNDIISLFVQTSL